MLSTVDYSINNIQTNCVLKVTAYGILKWKKNVNRKDQITAVLV